MTFQVSEVNEERHVEEAKAASAARSREFVSLVVDYGKRYWPKRKTERLEITPKPPVFAGRIGTVLPYLRALPWLLAAAFAVSFVWDFSGLSFQVLGRTFSIEGIMRICAISGLIGFGTNWLAITMLFQPRDKRAILPQGLIPAQRERVIFRLTQAISQELINEEIIQQKIQESGVISRYRDSILGTIRGVVDDPEFRTELKSLTEGYVRDVLGSESVRQELSEIIEEKLAEQNLGRFVKLYRAVAETDFQRRLARALDEIPEAVVPMLNRLDVALDNVPERLERHADTLEATATRAVLSFVEDFDIRGMLVEKASAFDEGQLEDLLKKTSNEQLNYIKYLGAILGVIGGLVIWQPVSLAVIAAGALGVWGIDEVLLRGRGQRS